MRTLYDDHVISDIFKLWIRELPEPLLTWALYPEWIAAVSGGNCYFIFVVMGVVRARGQEPRTKIPFQVRYRPFAIEEVIYFCYSSAETSVPELKKIVQKLPADNKYLLQIIIKCLRQVVDNSNVNKMTASNVALIFGMQ